MSKCSRHDGRLVLFPRSVAEVGSLIGNGGGVETAPLFVIEVVEIGNS